MPIPHIGGVMLPALAQILSLHLNPVDYMILIIYFLFVIGIGVLLRRYVKTGEDFLTSGRSVPAWICGLAFISANLGAQELIGMGASGAKYGIMTSHFYWLGAVPAMVFVGVFMIPFYYGSKARSVPEYLKLRFDEKTRAFNACSFAVMTIFSSGVSMYALAHLLEILLGWNFHFSLVVSALIVLAYTFLGGLTAAIYNEVLQFFLIVLGFLPLALLGLKDMGGWNGLVARLNHVAAGIDPAHGPMPPGTWTSVGRHLDSPLDNPDGRRVVQPGVRARVRPVVRLLVHRLPGDSAGAGGPVDGRGPADAADRGGAQDVLPVHRDPAGHDRDRPELCHGTRRLRNGHAFLLPPNGSTIPAPITTWRRRCCWGITSRRACSGLGMTALMASFMSGMAGNVTAFNTVWTYDIYQSYIRPGQSDRHYLRMGQFATVFGIALSMVAAYAGEQVQQHHGPVAAGLRVRQCAAVRDVPAGHVLEAIHRPRRVLGPAVRHARRRHPSRAYAAPERSAGRQRRLADRAAHVLTLSERDGAGISHRHLGVLRVLRDDLHYLAAHRRAPRATKTCAGWSIR